jgi:hypothetical protein
LIAGKNGTGKSVLACYLLSQSPGHWIIINPKHTKSYSGLGGKVVDTSGRWLKKLTKSLTENRFTVFNPDGDLAEPEALDQIIKYLHDKYENFGLCADELYTLHTGGRAKSGLLALLTRGRERKQSFIGLTQRPSWISQFCFSESEYFGCLGLQIEDDKKRMCRITGRDEFSMDLRNHSWLWYNAEKDIMKKFGAVPIISLDKSKK